MVGAEFYERTMFTPLDTIYGNSFSSSVTSTAGIARVCAIAMTVSLPVWGIVLERVGWIYGAFFYAVVCVRLFFLLSFKAALG